MTIPLPAIPNVTPSQNLGLVPGVGDALAGQIAGFLKTVELKKQMDERHQQFLLDSQKALAEIKQTEALTGEAKASTDQIKQQIKEHEEQYADLNAAHGLLAQITGGQKSFEEALAEAKTPGVVTALMKLYGDVSDTQRKATDATRAASDLQVAQAAAPGQEADAKNKKTMADLTAEALATNPLARQAAINQLLGEQAPSVIRNQDIERQRQAANDWWTRVSTGLVSYGEAAKQTGYQLPEGLDPNTVLAKESDKRAAWQQKRYAGLYQLAVTTDAMVQQLTTKAGGVTIPAEVFRDVPLGNYAISPIQRQLLQAGRAFTANWIFFISGAVASDKERDQAMKTVFPVAGDDAATLQQKNLVRGLMVSTMEQAAGGVAKPRSEILHEAVESAKSIGVSPNLVKYMAEQELSARVAEKNGTFSINAAAALDSLSPQQAVDSLDFSGAH